jgi:hypothetical protein
MTSNSSNTGGNRITVEHMIEAILYAFVKFSNISSSYASPSWNWFCEATL